MYAYIYIRIYTYTYAPTYCKGSATAADPGSQIPDQALRTVICRRSWDAQNLDIHDDFERWYTHNLDALGEALRLWYAKNLDMYEVVERWYAQNLDALRGVLHLVYAQNLDIYDVFERRYAQHIEIYEVLEVSVNKITVTHDGLNTLYNKNVVKIDVFGRTSTMGNRRLTVG